MEDKKNGWMDGTERMVIIRLEDGKNGWKYSILSDKKVCC